MVYFISEAKIKEMCNDNISSEIIKTGIINVQTIQLKEIIGDSLSKTLETLITNNVVVEPYKTLLDSYITPYMQYAVLAEIVVPATYKIGNIGLNQPYTDNVNTTTKSECVYVKQYYTERAAFMENRLTTYLEANRGVFTDYQNYKDITVAKSTTTQAGLFLGGKTRGNSVDNTRPTFIHDNTIRAYIRYDEAQNLTPDQQAQAKLNIGIENINFDDIYTKDEINNNYYTKEETDTLISNINTFSGDYNDLENKPNLANVATSGSYNDLFDKPNVYSKSEIDNIISGIGSGNNFSGSYNDLTDKPTIPTKTSELELDNVYSRSQVDTLINQIPTFSGDYNDLTNKPTLFDGDYNSLENKPTLFSGSYNDLSDKPTIPTATSQLQLDNVYNKSEIDLQFETVNTTLGNINNILETI